MALTLSNSGSMFGFMKTPTIQNILNILGIAISIYSAWQLFKNRDKGLREIERFSFNNLSRDLPNNPSGSEIREYIKSTTDIISKEINKNIKIVNDINLEILKKSKCYLLLGISGALIQIAVYIWQSVC